MAFTGVCRMCGDCFWHPDSQAVVKMAMLTHVSRNTACSVGRPQEIDRMVWETCEIPESD